MSSGRAPCTSFWKVSSRTSECSRSAISSVGARDRPWPASASTRSSTRSPARSPTGACRRPNGRDSCRVRRVAGEDRRGERRARLAARLPLCEGRSARRTPTSPGRGDEAELGSSAAEGGRLAGPRRELAAGRHELSEAHALLEQALDPRAGRPVEDRASPPGRRGPLPGVRHRGVPEHARGGAGPQPGPLGRGRDLFDARRGGPRAHLHVEASSLHRAGRELARGPRSSSPSPARRRGGWPWRRGLSPLRRTVPRLPRKRLSSPRLSTLRIFSSRRTRRRLSSPGQRGRFEEACAWADRTLALLQSSLTEPRYLAGWWWPAGCASPARRSGPRGCRARRRKRALSARLTPHDEVHALALRTRCSTQQVSGKPWPG